MRILIKPWILSFKPWLFEFKVHDSRSKPVSPAIIPLEQLHKHQRDSSASSKSVISRPIYLLFNKHRHPPRRISCFRILVKIILNNLNRLFITLSPCQYNVAWTFISNFKCEREFKLSARFWSFSTFTDFAWVFMVELKQNTSDLSNWICLRESKSMATGIDNRNSGRNNYVNPF